jgi:hypothetical protein
MALISGLKFGESWWFLGLWLLVLSHPSSNWGSELDFHSPRLSLWDLGPGGLLGFCSVGPGSRGFGGSFFSSDCGA